MSSKKPDRPVAANEKPGCSEETGFLQRPLAPASWSLAARLTAWYAGSASLLILAVAGALYWALFVNLDREDDQLLANKIHILRRVLRDRPEELAAMAQEVEWQHTSQSHMMILVRILDGDHRAVMETPDMAKDLPADKFPVPAGVEAAPGRGLEFEATSGKAYRIIAVRAAAGRSDAATHILQVAIDCTFEEHLLADYRRKLFFVVSGSLVACALISYLIARHGLRPLGRMDAAASRISSATLDQRLALDGLPAELFTLASTFNAMLNRLEASFQQLSRFSADIAHELRTPVNNVRGEAEVALGEARTPDEYRETLGSVLEECGRLARLIDSLLFLARAESPEAEIAKEPVDLRREIEAVCALYEATADEADVAVTVNAPEGLVADLDRGLFQRAIGNLLANALAHTPRGGRITLTTHNGEAALRIDVQDTGCGISAEHLPFVFDRFYRADPARMTSAGHVGLGLALVKRIAELHRGKVSIASELGRGTCISLMLPPAEGQAFQPDVPLNDAPVQAEQSAKMTKASIL